MKNLWIGLAFVLACRNQDAVPSDIKLHDDERYGWFSPFVVVPLDNDSIYRPAKFWVLKPELSALLEFRNGSLIYFPENETDTILTFQYKVQTDLQTQSAVIRLKFSQNWPCYRGAQADYDTTFKNAEFKKIEVQTNDRFCGQKASGLSLFASPRFGEVKIENDQLYYRPKSGYIGSDTFVYQVQSPKDYAPVFVRIFQDSGCVLVAKPDYKSFAYRGRVLIDVLENDKITCPDDFDKNRFLIVSQPQKATLVFQDSKLFFEMNAYAPGRYSAVYQICFRNGECSYAPIILDVLPCPPIEAHEDYEFMFSNWESLEINYLKNDSYCLYNLRLDKLAIAESPKRGQVQILGEKFVYYLMETNFLGTDSFLYRICDGQSNCDTARVFVSVRKP
jgi:phage pi2 protein 07